ncbi:STAS domain-containing protein [Amycolatopsis sp. cmx-4-68]|uniref:STAS domain-containing protein n=1 Tax=Amycolatopsis sp. cmx-4-68 TaxID=2790938 RepID=UPI00397C8E8A
MHDIITRPGVAPLPGTRTRITVTTTAERTIVTIAGELDMAVTGRFAAQLDEELSLTPRALIIDLTRLGFCAARGLTVVLDAVATAHAAGIPVAVVADGRPVLRPVRALGLERALPLHRSLTDAQEWLGIAVFAKEQ